MFNPKKLAKISAYVMLFFTLLLIFSTEINAQQYIESPSASYTGQVYNRGTGFNYKPNQDVILNSITIEETNLNYMTFVIYENGTSNKYFENTTIIPTNNPIVNLNIILNASSVYSFMLFKNGCVSSGRTNLHDNSLTYPIVVNYGNITSGILSDALCILPEIEIFGDGYSFTSWNITPIFIPKVINVTSFNSSLITNGSIFYNWNYIGNAFTWNELYLNDILYYNSTISSIRNFSATGLESGTVYIAKYIAYYNSTLFDFKTTTDTTLTVPITQAEAIQEFTESFNLFVFLIILVSTIFIPLIAKVNYKENAQVIIVSGFLVQTILLFYIHTIETGVTPLLKWVISIIILGSMFILQEETLV